jgi:hypothetical protein
MDIDKLERLASLRDSGAITDAEFEAEKAKLLQESHEYEPPYKHDEPPRRTGRIVGAVVAVFLVGGAAALYASGQMGSGDLLPASFTAPIKSAIASGDSGWGFTTSTDPMSDAEVVSAKRRIEAGDYLVDAKVTCTGRTTLQYEFDIFRKDDSGDGIALQEGMGLNGVPFLSRTYEIRLDSGPRATATVNSRHSNAIVTKASDSVQPSLFGPSPTDSQRIAAARKITIKVPMQHNDLTFEIPQTDSNIRQFLDACHKVDPNAGFVPSEQEQVPEAKSEQPDAADTTDEQSQTSDDAQTDGNSDQ